MILENMNQNSSLLRGSECSSDSEEIITSSFYDNNNKGAVARFLTRSSFGNKRHFLLLRNRVWSWTILKRKFLVALLGLALLILYVSSYFRSDEVIPVLHYSHVPGMKDYLVWSENCKIPNLDPHLPEVMNLFKRQKYEQCSSLKPLTRVDFVPETQRYALIIIKENLRLYTKSGNIDCCYQSIERKEIGENADAEVNLTKCISFKNETQLESTIDNVLIKCSSGWRLVYINGHAMMPARAEIRERLNEWQSKSNGTKGNATSVLIIGIDSISRMNLIRAMPKTAQYLYDNEWFEMSGYNKIADNTFPNLMAILVGFNSETTWKKCPYTKLRGLDNCPFVWNTFRDHGYVTAYAEDKSSISTFNFLSVGFEKPPVDYYMRPFLLSAERDLLPINLIDYGKRCLGMQNAADFIYNYALELSKRYEHEPYFGLFWTNSFSHDAISDCSVMDERIVEYLEKFTKQGTLNKAIVIFLSDHGMRFGPIRKTYSGYLEERLPSLFFWLPPHLKQTHPEFVDALNLNKNHLTNPYDVHMTLKHVLSMSGRVTDPKNIAPAESCKRCQTLLAPVPHNRSCRDIAIEDHWCTCIPFERIYKKSEIVQKLAWNSVNYINNFIITRNGGKFAKPCHTLYLIDIENAYRAKPLGSESQNESLQIYRIVFRTRPGNALYERTVRYNATSGDFTETRIIISRLNSYAKDSYCVEDVELKMYCYCQNGIF